MKISRLIIKRGFSFRWLRLVSGGFRDDDRVKPGVAKSSVRVARVGLRPIRDKRGENNHRSINQGCEHRKQIRQSNNSHRKQNFNFCKNWAVTTTHGTSGKRSWWWRSSRRYSSLRKGARTRSSGNPDLRIVVAAEQW